MYREQKQYKQSGVNLKLTPFRGGNIIFEKDLKKMFKPKMRHSVAVNFYNEFIPKDAFDVQMCALMHTFEIFHYLRSEVSMDSLDIWRAIQKRYKISCDGLRYNT